VDPPAADTIVMVKVTSMSDIATALAKVNAFETSSPQTVAWKLDRAATVQRIRTLVQHPDRLHQARLNVCGPAAFFRVWFARDPVAAAEFSCNLLRDGSATVGSLTVAPKAMLKAQDYAAIRAASEAAQPHSMPETADWMLLSALRDSENVIPYMGDPNSAFEWAAAVTLPMTLASWLRATNLYASLSDETSIVAAPNMPRLLSFIPTSNVDIILLVSSAFNAHLYPTLASRPASPPVGAGAHIPNHYVLTTAPFGTEGTVWLNMECWTWGRTVSGWVGTADFGSKYFGPIVATAP
jgi:hypothetical protein